MSGPRPAHVVLMEEVEGEQGEALMSKSNRGGVFILGH